MAKQSNSAIRVQSILDSVEKRIETVRGMTNEEIKEFEAELTAASLIVKERVDVVGILSGREISDKAFEHLVEIGKEEFLRAINEGATFESKQVPYFDVKTKKMSTRIVYYSPQAIFAGQVTDKIANEEDMLKIKWELNHYEMRRNKSMSKRDALNSAKKAIRRVKLERKEQELNQQLEEKKIKRESIVAMGKRLMESLPVQPVNPLLTA